MAIYIKGMEMPKHRAIDLTITPDGSAIIWGTTHRLLDEKCTYIPEPHGRLVDADALYKEFVKESDYFINEIENQEKNPNEYTDNFRIYTGCVLSGLSSAMISLYNAPTVIEGSE